MGTSKPSREILYPESASKCSKQSRTLPPRLTRTPEDAHGRACAERDGAGPILLLSFAQSLQQVAGQCGACQNGQTILSRGLKYTVAKSRSYSLFWQSDADVSATRSPSSSPPFALPLPAYGAEGLQPLRLARAPFAVIDASSCAVGAAKALRSKQQGDDRRCVVQPYGAEGASAAPTMRSIA